MRAHEWKSPASTDVAFVTPEADTGTIVEVDEAPMPGGSKPMVDPFPSWPKAFSPQQRTLPSATVAQVWSPPAATEVAVVIEDEAAVTGTVETVISTSGLSDMSVQETPSCPPVLSPQH